MPSLFQKTVLTSLGAALLTLPASAAATKSLTKQAAGLSYKLTTANPLPMGEQKLTLKLMRGGQILKGAQFTAVATMTDGMKTPVKITPQANGELALKTTFSMGGEWQITLQQSTPVKAKVTFQLMVVGGAHGTHHR